MRYDNNGAFKMAATDDYLFGYKATARVIDNWIFEGLSEAYFFEPQVRNFFLEKNLLGAPIDSGTLDRSNPGRPSLNLEA